MPVAQLFGVNQIFRHKRTDSFRVGGGELQWYAEGNGGHDRELVRGIDSAHIETWIGFGITELLGFGEHIIEGAFPGPPFP